MNKRTGLFILIAFLTIQTFSFQHQRLDSEYVQKVIQKHLDSIYDASTDFGGATVGVVLPNDKALEFAVGLADIANKTPMNPDHRMLGGSTGKIFVSASIMQLVESGQVKLDEPLVTYLGELDWFDRIQNSSSISIRNLLQHASGISRYVFESTFQEDLKKDATRIWTPAALMSYVLDKEPLFAAGKDFAYADTNYILLGMVVEKVSGKSMYEYIATNILKPFELNRISPQVDRMISGLAIGYSAENDPFYPGTVVENGNYKYNVQFEWAGGGFVNNARDLARAGKLIYENKVFDKELMPEFLSGIPAKGLGGVWGLGVHIKDSPIGLSYGHSGFFPGYITNMLYFPDQGFSIAIQVNTSDGKNMGLYRKMFSLIPVIAKLLTE